MRDGIWLLSANSTHPMISSQTPICMQCATRLTSARHEHEILNDVEIRKLQIQAEKEVTLAKYAAEAQMAKLNLFQSIIALANKPGPCPLNLDALMANIVGI